MMTPRFSAYLDTVRFLAALIVFLGHAAGQNWTGGFLWQLGPYGDTCVVVFFVLSGFVIGYVSDVKEHTWQIYTVSRVARLWSVALPALALTLVIDTIGVRIAPELYIGQPWFKGDDLPLRYLASTLMLQDIWHLQLVPGINLPFWSLSYEAIYYFLFGVMFFAKTRIKWFAVACIVLISGPVIAALFPIWLLGLFAYKISKQMIIPRVASYILFFGGLALLIFSTSLRAAVPFKFHILDAEIIERYIDAIAFFMNLVGAYQLTVSTPNVPRSVRKCISYVAGTTFVLYLFHRPLIQFFSYIGPADAASWSRRLLVIGGTLVLVFLATPLTERLRIYLRGRSLAAFSSTKIAAS